MCTKILILNASLEPIIPFLSPDLNILREWEMAGDHYIRNDVQGLVTSARNNINKEMLDLFPSLKIISHFGVGVDCIDMQEAKKREIIVTNTPHVLTHDTADLAFGLLIALARDIIINHNFVKNGHWIKSNPSLNMSLRGKTIGIVGLGRIGTEIAKRAVAFGMKVIYWGRSTKTFVNYEYVDSLINLAKRSDFLVISCVGNSETKNLINREVLENLGNKSFLINVSRGFVVNELDLIAVLSEGGIAGAGLDVFESEPNVSSVLCEMDNVILQPHVGSATHESRAKMAQVVADNINSYFINGEVINPA